MFEKSGNELHFQWLQMAGIKRFPTREMTAISRYRVIDIARKIGKIADLLVISSRVGKLSSQR